MIIKYFSIFFFSFGLGTLLGYFLFYNNTKINIQDEEFNITDIGSDYIQMSYVIPNDLNITNTNISNSIFLFKNENQKVIRNLLPDQIYYIKDIVFNTKNIQTPYNITKLTGSYRNNNTLSLEWEEPFSFGGNQHIYEVLVGNQIKLLTNQTNILFHMNNNTNEFRVRVKHGWWSDVLLCVNILYIPPICGMIQTIPVIRFTSSWNQVQISWDGVVHNIEFQNEIYSSEKNSLVINNLIPATNYSIVIDNTIYYFQTEEHLQCGNVDDLNTLRIIYNSFIETLQSSTYSSVLSLNIVDCVSSSIQQKTQLSTGCSSCFGINAKCAVSNCSSKCMFNSKSFDCISCSTTFCSSNLLNCAGIPAYLIPQPTIGE